VKRERDRSRLATASRELSFLVKKGETMGEGTLPVGMLAGRLASGNSSRARSVVVESIERAHNTVHSKVGSRASSWVCNFFL